MRFTSIIAASAALLACGNANPLAAEHELAPRASTCVQSDINMFKTVSKRPIKFCEWWLDGTRVHSPMQRLSVTQLTNVCKCVTGKATKRDIEMEAPRKLRPKKRATTCDTQKKALAADWTVPDVFCSFWELNGNRPTSPFPDISSATLYNTCKCQLNQQPKCVEADVTEFKKISSKPYVFCDWWTIKGRILSPSRTLTAKQINTVCQCLNAEPQAKRLLAAERAIGAGVVKLAAATSCNSANMATFDADWTQPLAFAHFWQAAERGFSPFPDLSVAAVSAVASCKLGQISSTSSSKTSTSTKTTSTTTKTTSTTVSTTKASTTVSTTTSEATTTPKITTTSSYTTSSTPIITTTTAYGNLTMPGRFRY